MQLFRSAGFKYIPWEFFLKAVSVFKANGYLQGGGGGERMGEQLKQKVPFLGVFIFFPL